MHVLSVILLSHQRIYHFDSLRVIYLICSNRNNISGAFKYIGLTRKKLTNIMSINVKWYTWHRFCTAGIILLNTSNFFIEDFGISKDWHFWGFKNSFIAIFYIGTSFQPVILGRFQVFSTLINWRWSLHLSGLKLMYHFHFRCN